MQGTTFTLFALSFCLSCASDIACTSDDQPEQEPLTAKVDKLFAKWDSWDSPGAAVAIIKDGSVVYKRGYGSANLEYNVAITPSTIFHVASISKQFTAFAIAMLAEQGKLSLDDEIQKYLPEVPDFGKTITIRHLIHHTSGLRDQWKLLAMAGWRLDDVITREHILKMVSHQKELNFDPGEEFLYCNTGYTLLAEIVARLSGQSFCKYTELNIFRPLGMTNTHFHDDHEMIVKNRAYSYSPRENGGFKKSVLSFANVGATSLFTTVEDMVKWIQNFEDGRVGGAVLEQMYQHGVLNDGTERDYAFGLAISEYRDLKTVGHGGADAGYRSDILWFPGQDFGVVVLSNLGSFNPGGLTMQVAEIYLADQFAPAETEVEEAEKAEAEVETVSLTPEQLAEFVGDYYSEELGTFYTIVVQDGKLVVQHRRHDDMQLTPTAEDEFAGAVGQFHFQRDEDQKITGFRLTGGRVRNLLFDKWEL